MSEKEQRRKARKAKKASHHTGPHTETLSDRKEDRTIRDHEDVLQNIESIVRECWRQDPDIDDRTVALAIDAALGRTGPANELSEAIADALQQFRPFRPDLPEDTWRNALRVVLKSIQRHSSLRPGDRDYLQFLAAFLP